MNDNTEAGDHDFVLDFFRKLVKDRRTTMIDLSKTAAGPEMAFLLGKLASVSLRTLRLERLTVSAWSGSTWSNFWNRFSQGVSDESQLDELDISGNVFSDEHAVCVVEALRRVPSLRTLKVNDCSLSAAAISLFCSLQVNTLEISNNKLGGGEVSLGTRIPASITMRNSGSGRVILREIVAGSQLDVSHSELSPTDAVDDAISRGALSSVTAQRSFVTGHTLLAALEHADPVLKQLDLSFVNVSAWCPSTSQAYTGLLGLHTLRLRAARLSVRGVEAIACAMNHQGAGFEELDLSENDHAGLHANVFHAIVCHPYLKKITWGNAGLATESTRGIALRLRQNRAAVELSGDLQGSASSGGPTVNEFDPEDEAYLKELGLSTGTQVTLRSSATVRHDSSVTWINPPITHEEYQLILRRREQLGLPMPPQGSASSRPAFFPAPGKGL